jgi:hypothetical protein
VSREQQDEDQAEDRRLRRQKDDAPPVAGDEAELSPAQDDGLAFRIHGSGELAGRRRRHTRRPRHGSWRLGDGTDVASKVGVSPEALAPGGPARSLQRLETPPANHPLIPWRSKYLSASCGGP